MNITRDDDDFLIIESKTLLVWLVAGLVGLAPVGGVLLMVLNNYDVMVLAMFTPVFAGLAVVLIYQSPETLVCFNRKARKVLMRRRWPWGAKEEAVAFKAIRSVTVDRVYGRSGPSYKPVLTLRDGRTLQISQVTNGNQALSSRIVERVGACLNADVPPAEGTGKLPRRKPVEVAAEAKPEPRINRWIYLAMGLMTVGFLAFEVFDGYQDHQEREERHRSAAARRAQAAEKEQRASQSRGAFHRDLQAAEQGDGDAMVRVARGYANGKGTRLDPDKGLLWTRKAIAKDVPDAYAIMGHLTLNGAGVAASVRGAETWYRKAADRGSAEGLYGLSTVYYFGKELPQDLPKAHAYMVLAARGRYHNAVEAVTIIGNKLSPEQKQASQAQVEAWDQAHPGLKITS